MALKNPTGATVVSTFVVRGAVLLYTDVFFANMEACTEYSVTDNLGAPRADRMEGREGGRCN